MGLSKHDKGVGQGLQVRWGTKPDGVCLVVGSCGRGFPDNETADVIYTNTAIQAPDAPAPDLQYFWEAFPAGSGPSDRTTYMFTYLDAEPGRWGRPLDYRV